MTITVSRISPACLALAVYSAALSAANIGTLVPVRGTVGDIALDEGRNRLYITNMAAYRIEAMNTQDRSFDAPMPVSKPPTGVAGGASTGQVGVYQINATVPAGIGDAAQALLAVRQGNNATTVQVRIVTP